MRIGNGPQDPSISLQQFKELIKLVAQPQSTMKYEQPGITAQIKHSPPGVFDFQMIESGPDKDLVIFNAQTDENGNHIKPLQFQTKDMSITPTTEKAQNIFFDRVIQPLYSFFFEGKDN